MINISIAVRHPLSVGQIEFMRNSLSATYPDVSVQLNNGELTIFTRNSGDAAFLRERVQKLLFISRGIADSRDVFSFGGSGKYRCDPLPHLEGLGDVRRVSPGMFQFQGDFLRVFKSLNALVLKGAIESFGAVEQENPILWPIDLYKKINYLREFPQQALLLVGVKRSEDPLRRVAARFSSDSSFDCIPIDSDFDSSVVGVQSAVCDTCYYALRDRNDVSDSVFTTYNKVFRNEASHDGHLDRLSVFSVRDVIFVGSEVFVLEMRQKAIEYVAQLMNDFELSGSISVADDPFFVGSVEKKLFQSAFELKYEMLAEIPFLKKSVAIGSINYHVDSFGRAFDIKREGSLIYSACVGFGFERICLALFSQFGPTVSDWPTRLKTLLHVEEFNVK